VIAGAVQGFNALPDVGDVALVQATGFGRLLIPGVLGDLTQVSRDPDGVGGKQFHKQMSKKTIE
jgi:hypothetical protein